MQQDKIVKEYQPTFSILNCFFLKTTFFNLLLHKYYYSLTGQYKTLAQESSEFGKN